MSARPHPATPPRTDDEVAGRYRHGPWVPAELYCRLIVEDLRAMAGAAVAPTVLDIGCGHGLMGYPLLQEHIADHAGPCIGIEPDPQAEPSPVFGTLHRVPFEQAPLPAASVDLAYAAMVLEHLPRPAEFFARLAQVLRPGGVFWAFTVDRRHYFSWFSQLIEATRLKERYLDRVRGRKGEAAARYDNYPTFYRCNSPAALQALAGADFTLQCWSLHRVGQLDGYVPYRLRRLSHLADRAVIRLGLPGSVLVARLVRR
ncbi:MAG: class I SAM-dependent methyltransferase [Burkholderiales bacterium]|nr:class I SAM-dependent methyltransferase [Burkholderiales bacterium]